LPLDPAGGLLSPKPPLPHFQILGKGKGRGRKEEREVMGGEEIKGAEPTPPIFLPRTAPAQTMLRIPRAASRYCQKEIRPRT